MSIEPMHLEVTIMQILKRGNYIRMMDGRYTDGFVDLNTLQTIIARGDAEVFSNKGVKMARLTQRPADLRQTRRSKSKKVSGASR